MCRNGSRSSVGVPTIEPGFHFLKVGFKMFCRDFMPRTNDAALQQRKGGFNAVRRNIAKGKHRP